MGRGTQDLGFRNEVDILFQAKPAAKVTMHVFESDDRPTTASFVIKDSMGRVYPSQAKRLAPDFAFQPQVYRGNGEVVQLPDGDYTIEYTRGPEYVKKMQKLRVDQGHATEMTFHLCLPTGAGCPAATDRLTWCSPIR